MLIDMKIALGMHHKVHHSVFANLLEHVVEEAKSGGDVTLARAVEVDADMDVGFLGGALHLGGALAGKQQFGYLVPSHTVFAQDKRIAPDVLGKLPVGVAVADDITAGYVIFGRVDILLNKACVGFAGGGVVLGEMTVDEDVVERDALAL